MTVVRIVDKTWQKIYRWFANVSRHEIILIVEWNYWLLYLNLNLISNSNLAGSSVSGVASLVYPSCDCYAHRETQLKLSLRWRHNEHDGISNHQPHDCLLNRLSKKTSKLRVTGLCDGNWPVTGDFPAQRASYAENVSIWWRHHGISRNLACAFLHREQQRYCWVMCDIL